MLSRRPSEVPGRPGQRRVRSEPPAAVDAAAWRQLRREFCRLLEVLDVAANDDARTMTVRTAQELAAGEWCLLHETSQPGETWLQRAARTIRSSSRQAAPSRSRRYRSEPVVAQQGARLQAPVRVLVDAGARHLATWSARVRFYEEADLVVDVAEVAHFLRRHAERPHLGTILLDGRSSAELAAVAARGNLTEVAAVRRSVAEVAAAC